MTLAIFHGVIILFWPPSGSKAWINQMTWWRYHNHLLETDGHHSICNFTAVRSHQSISFWSQIFAGGQINLQRWFVCGGKNSFCLKGNATRGWGPKGSVPIKMCRSKWKSGPTIPGHHLKLAAAFFLIHISYPPQKEKEPWSFKALSTPIVMNRILGDTIGLKKCRKRHQHHIEPA